MRNLAYYLDMHTALNQLPARIANKLQSIDNKGLALIRGNRLARTNGGYELHLRRHHIFLACIDIRVQRTNEKRAAFRALCGI